MKKIIVMPVKNEEWILEKSLACAGLFADHIIVADQGSTDRTSEICRKFPKAVYLFNPSSYPGTQNRRQILLDKARELYGGENIIFCLDADEIPTGNILDNREWRNLLENLESGWSVSLQMLNLWRSPFKYRDDNSAWSHSWKPFIFRDDGKTNYAPGNVHEGKTPAGFENNNIKFESVKILHFQFVLWQRMLAKQAHCRVMEKKALGRNAFKINARYWISKDERNIKLKKIDDNWIIAYKENGVALENFNENNLYWYDAEILEDFKKYGLNYFKRLDIWDIDWEKKRQEAIKRGFKNLPEYSIKDPRLFYIKFYHRYLQPFLGYNSFLYKIYKLLK